jgi:hypothetical protein
MASNDRDLAVDDSAADSLPVALAGTVILMAVIVGLAAFGIMNATPAVEMASVDRQVHAVANDCRFLLSLAPRYLDDPGSPPGAMRYADLDLPEGTEYLSFGFDPESGSGHEGTIYYKVCGSKKAVVVDEIAGFRAKEGGHTILRAGRYHICVEYACDPLGGRLLLIAGAQA